MSRPCPSLTVPDLVSLVLPMWLPALAPATGRRTRPWAKVRAEQT
jgi:hypothetical protein